MHFLVFFRFNAYFRPNIIYKKKTFIMFLFNIFLNVFLNIKNLMENIF